MKSLIKFIVTLAIGAFLGYVFHDAIDSKLKSKFGGEKIESVKKDTKKLANDGARIGKAAVEAGKKEAMKNEQE
jgi:hypothetical protein